MRDLKSRKLHSLLIDMHVSGGGNNESKNNTSMHRLQAKKLQYNEKQEKRSRQIRNEKVLPILP
jgi:hypothetical protein